MRKLSLIHILSLIDGKYHYYLKDHQGNNRVVVDEEGAVEEVNDYYAFGGLMSTSSRPVSYTPLCMNRQQILPTELPNIWYRQLIHLSILRKYG